MSVARILTVFGIAVVSAGTTWVVWPRPDAAIEVAVGGKATVIDHLGRRTPLSDTMVVGGGGSRRRVRLINRDTMPHVIALFRAPAGGEEEYMVPPGVYGGVCSAHGVARMLTVVVR